MAYRPVPAPFVPGKPFPCVKTCTLEMSIPRAASASGGRYPGPRPRGVGPFGRFVRMEDFFGLKNEGAGIFGTQPQEMEGLEWKMSFSI